MKALLLAVVLFAQQPNPSTTTYCVLPPLVSGCAAAPVYDLTEEGIDKAECDMLKENVDCRRHNPKTPCVVSVIKTAPKAYRVVCDALPEEKK